LQTVKEQLVPVVGSFIRQLQVSQLRIRKSTEQVETDLSRTILTINSQSDQTAKSLTAAIDRITAAVDNVDQVSTGFPCLVSHGFTLPSPKTDLNWHILLSFRQLPSHRQSEKTLRYSARWEHWLTRAFG
jgi:hypothetical protein